MPKLYHPITDSEQKGISVDKSFPASEAWTRWEGGTAEWLQALWSSWLTHGWRVKLPPVSWAGSQHFGYSINHTLHLHEAVVPTSAVEEVPWEQQEQSVTVFQSWYLASVLPVSENL